MEVSTTSRLRDSVAELDAAGRLMFGESGSSSRRTREEPQQHLRDLFQTGTFSASLRSLLLTCDLRTQVPPVG